MPTAWACGTATVHPKATENIEQIIDLVQTLIDKGYAYALSTVTCTSAPRSSRATASSPTSRMEELAGRRPHRRERRQGGPPGLRPLEGRQARRALLGLPLGRGPSRLAHRVLRHVQPLPGQDHRHPLRRRRTLMFPHHENEIAQSEGCQRMYLRPLLAAQRLPEHQQPEDVQVPGQLLHRPRGRRSLRLRGRPLLHALRPVPFCP